MHKSYLVFAVLAILALSVIMTGCPQQTPDEGPPVTGELPDAGVGDEPADAPGDTPEESVEKPDSMKAFMDSVEMPKSYEATWESGDMKVKQLVMIRDGEPARVKMETEDGVLYFDVADQEMYIYDQDENTAMKMPLKEDAERDMDWKPDEYDSAAKIVGSETVDGVDCWVFEGDVEGDALKSWVGKKDGLPRKAIMGEDSISFSYDRLGEVSEDELKLPEDAEILDFSDMTGDQ